MKVHMKNVSNGKTRRAFLKGTAAAMAVPLIMTSRKGAAETLPPVLPPSPPTTPWQVDLPNEITPLQATSSLTPSPTEAPNLAAGEAGRASHQRFSELSGSPTLYEMTAMENPKWVFHPAYPEQPIWGFAGHSNSGPGASATTPGPTLFARYGRPVICRIHNQLPYDHVGFGTPEITTHLHNLHTPSESDGFPGDFYGPHPDQKGPTLSAPGEFLDHFYPNILAGYDEFHGLPGFSIGDPREALGTLWYHDHTVDFTAPNVYRGMAGFYLLFDDLDSGDEHDANPQALRLPSHPYDYPLILQDKRFDANGVLTFDQFTPEGVPGDKVTVNGRIEPVLHVARRKYRLRFLNGGPTRFYELYLVNAGLTAAYTFTYIANDGNLLPAPITDFKVRLGVAERADIVVDFSRFPVGTELYFVNRLVQPDNRGPTKVQAPGTPVLKFKVDRNPSAPDVSQVPSVLRPLRPLDTAEIAAAPQRRWVFERKNGMWAVNGQFFDVFSSRAQMRKGSAEVWELVNPDNGWSHPVHIHFEEGRILSRARNGSPIPIPAHERGRKDVYVLGPAESLKVLLRFRDFKGKYPMHCHNLVHEDHAMMVRWDIVD
jgi:FtsP/CotA-like multicopper oxidase with cupredoxin domain